MHLFCEKKPKTAKILLLVFEWRGAGEGGGWQAQVRNEAIEEGGMREVCVFRLSDIVPASALLTAVRWEIHLCD